MALPSNAGSFSWLWCLFMTGWFIQKMRGRQGSFAYSWKAVIALDCFTRSRAGKALTQRAHRKAGEQTQHVEYLRNRQKQGLERSNSDHLRH